MYVTKQLPPVEASGDGAVTVEKNKNETEESSSPSPTFSDISTGSTTPSTETLNDEEAVPPVRSEIATTPQNTNTTSWLGKQAPLWIPDAEAMNCMHCDMKFTVIKRRHHCRACGLVLCSKCCYLKHRLDYLDTEARVCNKCYEILNGGEDESGNSPQRQPNPNNPMEYCSMVPPLQQVSGAVNQNPPTVMVPVGVLKRTGSNKKSNKSVMFCDGIRPGSDLTNLDNDFNYNSAKAGGKMATLQQGKAGSSKNVPVLDAETGSFIPVAASSLPPTVTFYKSGKFSKN